MMASNKKIEEKKEIEQIWKAPEKKEGIIEKLRNFEPLNFTIEEGSIE